MAQRGQKLPGPLLGRRHFVLGAAALPLLATAANAGIGRRRPASFRAFNLMGEEGREIAVSHWSPEGTPAGTILFSHGAGSAPDKYLLMIEPWVAAGWQILAPLHVDSREHPRTADYPGLASWRTRLEDMRLLSAHIGDVPYVAAGHSYGGLVSLTLGGADAIPPEGIEGPLSDPKVTAAIAFSPPAPVPVLVTQEGYAALAVPALVQTGTADIVPGITEETADGWMGHLVPYTAPAAGGERYGLLLEGVDHYFGGAICDLDRPGPPQLERLEDAVEISALFLMAQGLGDAAAKSALDDRLSNDLPVRLTTR